MEVVTIIVICFIIATYLLASFKPSVKITKAEQVELLKQEKQLKQQKIKDIVSNIIQYIELTPEIVEIHYNNQSTH